MSLGYSVAAFSANAFGLFFQEMHELEYRILILHHCKANAKVGAKIHKLASTN